MAQQAFVLYPRNYPSPLILVHGKRGQLKKEASEARLIFLLAFFLGLMQIADAFLTYRGLTIFGAAAEGNSIIRGLCYSYGVLPALVMAKTFSLSCIVFVSLYGKHFRWLPAAFAALLVVHISAAIVPWSFLLI